jgi:hypothetical protein
MWEMVDRPRCGRWWTGRDVGDGGQAEMWEMVDSPRCGRWWTVRDASAWADRIGGLGLLEGLLQVTKSDLSAPGIELGIPSERRWGGGRGWGGIRYKLGFLRTQDDECTVAYNYT